MHWFSRRPIRAGEDWRERCLEGAYVPMGALFKFERKCRAGHGKILISTDG
jgi:hypothetical protein